MQWHATRPCKTHHRGIQSLCAWWKPVLPQLLRLMQYVLEQLQAGNTGAPVAAASTSSSGSINWQLPGAAAMAAAMQSRLAGLVSPLFRLLGAGSRHVGTLGYDESAPLSHAAAALVPSISSTTGNTALWLDNSAQLCTVVEGLLRMQAHGAIMAAHQAPGMLGDLQRLQATRGVVYELGSKVLSCVHPLVATVGSTVPGSQQQLQLFSLMCSYLKLCDYVASLDAHAANWGYWRATAMAGGMLEDISSKGVDSDSSNTAAAAGTPLNNEQPVHAAAAAAAAVQSGAGLPGTAVDGLPWLVLVGRCCLQSAATLRQMQASTPNLGQHLMQQLQRSAAAVLQQQREAEAAGAEGPSVGSYHDGVVASEHAAVLRMALTCSGEWLGQAGTAAELAAAGYPAESALQQIQAVQTQLNAGPPADAESALGAQSELAAQLQSLGLVLTSLAMPHACNNPACSNMAGPTELAAVSGRSCMCAGCLTARYCSRVCQKQHWKQHKPVCKALAAAAAAAAAAGGS